MSGSPLRYFSVEGLDVVRAPKAYRHPKTSNEHLRNIASFYF